MDDSTILGNDFANWATNGVMTELLDYELACLEQAMFDGASGEAVHKELHRISQTTTGSGFRYQCGSLRLEQNLREYDITRDNGLVDSFSDRLGVSALDPESDDIIGGKTLRFDSNLNLSH